MIEILGISGSLRARSFNSGLLRAAVELAPAGTRVRIQPIADLPPYNEDVQRTGDPPAVAELKARVRAADGLLFASPEYNYSFSGVLKNAIDWVSRPPAECPFAGKPGAIMGVSGGRWGTVRSQAALRPVLASVGMLIVPRPEVCVTFGPERFDESLNLIDEQTRDQVAALLAALVDLVRRGS